MISDVQIRPRVLGCVVALAVSVSTVAAPPVTAAIQANPGAVIYVSPTGSDANPGTAQLPVQTLPQAAALARVDHQSEPGPVTVILQGGTYRLTAPLNLGPADSGSTQSPTIWTAAPGSPATVSGAVQISGWRQLDDTQNMWMAPVPPSLTTRQIYVDGVRAQMAAGRVPGVLKQTKYGFTDSSTLMAHWSNRSQIEFVWVGQMGRWAEQICPVGKIRGHSIWMAQPCWSNTLRYKTNLVTSCCLGSPTFIQNARELLTQPGQFYLDGTHHLLYYIPRPGQDMLHADVEAPALQSLLQAHGTVRHPFAGVQFSNIDFEYSTWLQPGTSNGFSEIQSGYTLTGRNGGREGLCQLAYHGTCPYGSWTPEPAAVSLSYDRNVTFTRDVFVHLGAAALDLGNGSQNDTVSGSVFTDISGNGIELGAVNFPRARGGAQTRSDQVVDNHLFGFPTEFLSGVPVLVGYAAGCLIAHNQIDHVPYTAVSMGWGGWLDKIQQPSVANFSQNNVVSDNLIYDFLSALSDGAAIYTLGITGASLTDGEKVEGNVIHGQLDWGRAMQSDDGAVDITYAQNIVYDDAYAWDCTHLPRCHTQRVQNNYWQQTYPKRSANPVLASGNTLISGPQDAPSSIVDQAGLQSAYTSLLAWTDGSPAPPGPPTGLFVFHGAAGQAYATWQPPVAEGSGPILSYTVQACLITPHTCATLSSITLSAQQFDQAGYVVVTGLKNSRKYWFRVSAANADGSGIQSLESTATIGRGSGHRPGHVRDVTSQTGAGEVAISWTPPKSAVTNVNNPIISYQVACSDGQTQTVTGAGQLLPLNVGSRQDTVFGGLTPGAQYTFTITPVGTRGPGTPRMVGPLTPTQ